MTRKLLFGIVLALFSFTGASIGAETTGDRMSWGIHLLAGARYDNLRMCVGSPAGTEGGPIVEAYLDLRFPVSGDNFIVVNLPVMRPILFAAAFDMLQFEPQVTFEHHFRRHGKSWFVLGGGLGVILHYGPDYTSDKNNPSPSFFAAGPLFSISTGWGIQAAKGEWMPGLKVFYSPIFSADYPVGTVFGGGLEIHYIFG